MAVQLRNASLRDPQQSGDLLKRNVFAIVPCKYKRFTRGQLIEFTAKLGHSLSKDEAVQRGRRLVSDLIECGLGEDLEQKADCQMGGNITETRRNVSFDLLGR